MKYSPIPHKMAERFVVERLDGGLNLADSPEAISENQLSNCLNVWHSGGVLKTRPGIYTEAESLLYRISSQWDEVQHRFTDATVYYNGEYRRIAIITSVEDDSLIYCRFYLLGSGGSVVQIGTVNYYRVSSEIFFKPKSITVFSGAPTNGGGLYAFFSLSDMYNESSKIYEVHEISADFSQWSRITNFYIPTIYINGRGSDYELANSNNQAYTGKPTELEPLNLLSGWFYAYFTSDGYSSSFRLPVANIYKNMISCTVYYSPDSYCEWRIYEGQNENTQNFLSVSVTAVVDREKGTLRFLSNGEDYPIPKMSRYFENNIKIRAYKETGEEFKNIVSCTCAVRHNSRIFFSGGISGSEVYTAPVSNPLYFPLGAKLSLGNKQEPVTALAAQNNRLLAFKGNGIYTISLKEGDLFSKNSLLSDNPSLFYKADKLQAKVLNSSVGCVYPDTIQNCGGHLIWLGSDKSVYSLSPSLPR